MWKFFEPVTFYFCSCKARYVQYHLPANIRIQHNKNKIQLWYLFEVYRLVKLISSTIDLCLRYDNS